MVRAMLVGGLLIVGMASCTRGPGTLAGQLEGTAFELRTARIGGAANKFVIEAHDQPNGCTSKPKRARIIRMVLQSPADEPIPQPGFYALTDAGVPGVTIDRVLSNDLCAEFDTLRAAAAEVELVDVQLDPRTNTFEADFRLRLTFRDEVVEGSVHAMTCGTSAAFCDAEP